MTGWIAGGVALVKFRYHITFINVVFGAAIFAAHLDGILAWRLVALYVSFNILLYSGLYTVNDLADRESDARHPRKRQRPIASGRVSARMGAAWAAVFIVSGLGSGLFLFGFPVMWCYLAVMAINLAYSWGGRNVVYVDVVLNGLPHMVRFMMGALLAGRQPPTTHLVSILLLAVACSCLRRRVERDVPGWDARQSLRRWSLVSLDAAVAGSLAALGLVAFWHAAAAPGFYTAVLGTALVVVGGAYSSETIRRHLRWVWTH